MIRVRQLLPLLGLCAVLACKKEQPAPVPSAPAENSPRLIMKFRLDSTQVRLGNLGQPVAVPAGHGAQSPRFNAISAHYVEFAPLAFTALGTGAVVYHAPETTLGGSTAIDFAQEVHAGDGETVLDIPLASLPVGSYAWLRVSLSYQNYDVDFRYTDTVFGLGALDLTGTIASFIGFNTYIGSFNVGQQQVVVNGNRTQGYWAFEVNNPPVPLAPITGQAPAGATTVVNPLFNSSPIPAGSCVATGAFASPLVITGNETQDVTITVALSTNRSFEWTDSSGDGVFEPLAGDTVVDMGVRGLIPIVE